VSTEQEYDAQADMVDDQDPSESGPGPYPEPFPTSQQMGQQQALNQQPSQQPQQQQSQPQLGHQMGGNPQGYNSMTQLLDPYDPMLDMDPFGLSASMQFPTQFSFVSLISEPFFS
jgi:hypothetical protein